MDTLHTRTAISFFGILLKLGKTNIGSCPNFVWCRGPTVSHCEKFSMKVIHTFFLAKHEAKALITDASELKPTKTVQK